MRAGNTFPVDLCKPRGATNELVNPERVSSEQAQLYNEPTNGTFIALADTLNMHRSPSFSHLSVRWECDLNADTCNLHDGTYSPSA